MTDMLEHEAQSTRPRTLEHMSRDDIIELWRSQEWSPEQRERELGQLATEWGVDLTEVPSWQPELEETVLAIREDLPLYLGELSIELAMATSGHREAINQLLEFRQVLEIKDASMIQNGPTRKVLDVYEDNVIAWSVRASTAGLNYAQGVQELTLADESLRGEGVDTLELKIALQEKQVRPIELAFPYSEEMNPYIHLRP